MENLGMLVTSDSEKLELDLKAENESSALVTISQSNYSAMFYFDNNPDAIACFVALSKVKDVCIIH